MGGGRLSPRVAFIHKGWRTGGTAFLWALEGSRVRTYFDCLSPQLTGDLRKLLRESTPSSWASGHPREYSYWRNYVGVAERGRIRGFPPEFGTREEHYFLSVSEPLPSLRNYLEILISDARANRALPAISFEASDGLTPWLREVFADSIHVGLLRDPEDQLKSWLRQALQGATDFFSCALKIMRRWPIRFGDFAGPTKPSVRDWSAVELEGVFRAFDSVSRQLRLDGADFIVRPTELDEEAAREELITALTSLGIDDLESKRITRLLSQSRPRGSTAQDSLADLLDAWDSRKRD